MSAERDKISQVSRWLPLIVGMALISIFSTDNFSSENTGSVIEPILKFIMGKRFTVEAFDLVHYFIRKAAHLTEYAILGTFFFRAINPGLSGWRGKVALMTFLLSAVYAAFDEFHQSFTVSRGASPVDVMIDSTGALMALIVIWLYNKMYEHDYK